jgi:carbon monoxide dehydrogenase subunit G
MEQLHNEFTVGVPADRAWEVLTDVETIAPCLPGAKLEEIEGDEYRGLVKVKVGPITAQYKGKATFVERDEANRRAVIKAEGRDTRGQGNASALITAELIPLSPSSTKVSVRTDLTVTGKVAQFGRGGMAEIAAKLMGQFADNLSATVLADSAPATVGAAAAAQTASSAAPASSSPTPASSTTAAPPAAESAPPTSRPAPASSNGSTSGGVRKLNLPDPEPIDLVDAAGASVAKRVLPVVGIGAILLLLIRLLRK